MAMICTLHISTCLLPQLKLTTYVQMVERLQEVGTRHDAPRIIIRDFGQDQVGCLWGHTRLRATDV